MGWRTPCSRMDAASSWRLSSSNTIRGCSGFGVMRSTGTVRTPTVRPALSDVRRLTIAGESSRSSDRRRAAAARKSGLAKVDDLLCKAAIRPGGFRRPGVARDGPAHEWRLAQLHGALDDAAEDVVVADDPKLVEHVLGEVRPAVEERRQEAQDLEVAVQLHPDHVDDLDEVVEALHRVVLGLDRDDDVVRRDQAVDGQQAQVGRAVDQRKVVAVEMALEAVPQDLLAAQGSEQFALGRGKVDVGWGDIDPGDLGWPDDVLDGRATVGKDVGHRPLDGVEVDPETRGQVRLRIHVDAEDAVPLLG